MKPQLPDGYAAEYIFDTQLSLRPPTRYDTESVETMVTYATVFSIDEQGRQFDIESYEGKAIQNPTDTFSLNIGRDIALGRALKKLRTAEVRRERGMRVMALRVTEDAR